MNRRVRIEERRARLAARHRLVPGARTDDVARIADDLVVLHSSDPVSVYLSVAARMENPSLAAVDEALYERRSVLRHHGMRRTLWVGTPDVVRRVHAAATRRLIGPEHRRTTRLLAESGIDDPEAWLADARAQVLAALEERGPMSARQLGLAVPELRHPLVLGAGSKYEATAAAHTRVLLQLGFEGGILRTRPVGGWTSGQYTYAATRTWHPAGLDGLEEREAARDLADHWLRRFGPGTTADLQWWAGWTATTTKRALADCGAIPVEVETGDGAERGWLAAGDEDPVEPDVDWVALLPSLDPTVMGWKQRGWYLPAESTAVFDRNGNAGPTILVAGEVAGAWMQAPDGSIRTNWFVDRGARARKAAAAEADRIAAAVGETRFTVRFASPLHRDLVAGKPGDPGARRD